MGDAEAAGNPCAAVDVQERSVLRLAAPEQRATVRVARAADIEFEPIECCRQLKIDQGS